MADVSINILVIISADYCTINILYVTDHDGMPLTRLVAPLLQHLAEPITTDVFLSEHAAISCHEHIKIGNILHFQQQFWFNKSIVLKQTLMKN